MSTTNDTRVSRFETLPSPTTLRRELPISGAEILAGRDDRLLVVVGPCSVHDPEAALDYARRLAPLARELRENVLIVMRVYFEKPRSTGGWKGLINDPYLDGTHRVTEGLRIARKLLIDVLALGLPVGCEFLEPTSPQYIADAVSWGAIGARTTESQIHRQLASGVSMPIGFKNATDGDVQVAVDGCTVARQSHVFFGVDDDGRSAVVTTTGNRDAHVILRGGKSGPNYSNAHVAAASDMLSLAGVDERVVVDASHGNSGKDEIRQVEVVRELAESVSEGSVIGGVMLESFLVSGSQKISNHGARGLVYGQSVTDGCIGWDDTAALLHSLARASSIRQGLRSRREAPIDQVVVNG